MTVTHARVPRVVRPLSPSPHSTVLLAPDVLGLLSDWVRVIFAAAGIGLGLMVCCLGVRVVKFCVFLLGFGVGAVVGGVIAWRASKDDKTTLIACFVTGVVLGSLCLCIVKIGRYIAAAALGFLPVFLFIQTGGSKVRGGARCRGPRGGVLPRQMRFRVCLSVCVMYHYWHVDVRVCICESKNMRACVCVHPCRCWAAMC